LFEAAHSILVSGHIRGKNLQRHFAMEPRILRQMNLTHPTLADFREDAVMSNDGVGGYAFAQIASLAFWNAGPCLTEVIPADSGASAYP
jgi:hypothetical protein